MNAPLISVVIPVHNCARFVSLAIDSALAQEVSVEVLVLDDMSKDHLDQVMMRYQRDPRVIYCKNDRHLGVAETRNRGVNMARGEYIAFLDADDYWMPDKLKKQLVLLQKTGTVLCSTARELMEPDGTLTGHIISSREKITYRSLFLQNQVNCSSVLIKTSVAKEFPMHHDDCHEDYLMWLEVLCKYRVACAVNEPLLKYRISSTSKSGKKWKSAWMTFRVYRYMGYGIFRSSLQFCSYAVHGFLKYFRWFIKRKK